MNEECKIFWKLTTTKPWNRWAIFSLDTFECNKFVLRIRFFFLRSHTWNIKQNRLECINKIRWFKFRQSAIQPAAVHACFDYIFGAYLFDIQHLNEHTHTQGLARTHAHTDTFTIKLFGWHLFWCFLRNHCTFSWVSTTSLLHPLGHDIYDYKIRFGQLLIYGYRVSIKWCEHWKIVLPCNIRKLCALSMR